MRSFRLNKNVNFENEREVFEGEKKGFSLERGRLNFGLTRFH